MAKLLKHLGLGVGKKPPPQPPRPDYYDENSARPRVGPRLSGGDSDDDNYADPSDSLPTNFGGPSEGGDAGRKSSGGDGVGHHSTPPTRSGSSKSDSSYSVSSCGSGSDGIKRSAENIHTGAENTHVGKPMKPVVLDDYSDPYDIRKAVLESRDYDLPPDCGALRREDDYNNYSDPYDAQKIIQELRIQRSKESKEETRRSSTPESDNSNDSALYEDPYEPGTSEETDTHQARLARELEKAKETQLKQQQQQQPDEDARPAEDYDQPWEWSSKERLSQAFAAQLDQHQHQPSPNTTTSAEKRLAAVPENTASLHNDGRINKASRQQSYELLVTETIDPTIPLESQRWYHGSISRLDAEKALRHCKECSFLVRNSESSRTNFSLSIKSAKGFMHMKIAHNVDLKYILGECSRPFDTVPDVIYHYSIHTLNIKGAEHMKLRYPVICQLM